MLLSHLRGLLLTVNKNSCPQIMSAKVKANYILFHVLPFIVFFYLFFFINIAFIGSRSLNEVWNLGHMLAFGGMAFLLLRNSCLYDSWSLPRQVALIITLAIIVGVAIELVQSSIGRYASAYDLVLDVAGAVVGIVVFSRRRRELQQRDQILVLTGTLMFTLVVITPSLRVLTDDIIQKTQFPTLIDNTTPLESSRWQLKDSAIQIVDKELTDRKILKITFSTARFSSALLNYFPSDWSKYKKLIMDAHNPSDNVIQITISIQDQEHLLRHSPYADRYTGQYDLMPGWETISIPLTEVKDAPATRNMDMTKVNQLALVTQRLKKPASIYIRKIYLE